MKNTQPRFVSLIFTVLLGIGGLTVLLAGFQQISQVHAEGTGSPSCYTSLNNTNTTAYATGGSSAIQQAVDDVNEGGLVKVAGNCAGVFMYNGISQTIYISKSVTIQGGYSSADWSLPSDPDGYTTTVDALDGGRVVSIEGPAVVITLSGLVLQNGRADQIGALNGGAIATISGNAFVNINDTLLLSNTAQTTGGALYLNASDVYTLTQSTLRDNEALNENGGAIYSQGQLSLIDTIVEYNQAGHGGAGIFSNNGSQLYIQDSILRMNIANGDFLNGYGGALQNRSNPAVIDNTLIYSNTAHTGGGIINYGPLTITHSTLQENYTRGSGGAIQNHNPLWLINTTVSNNKAAEGGGGIFHSQGSLMLAHTTVVSNTAVSFGTGGIFYNSSGRPRLNGLGGTAPELSNSIIAHNVGPNGNNCYEGYIDLGYNLEGTDECGLNAAGSLTNTNPLLATQANYGGKTPVYGLLADSPAIDHIPDGVNGCGTSYLTDQRGMTRPTGDGCDIGAFEFEEQIIYLPIVMKP